MMQMVLELVGSLLLVEFLVLGVGSLEKARARFREKLIFFDGPDR